MSWQAKRRIIDRAFAVGADLIRVVGGVEDGVRSVLVAVLPAVAQPGGPVPAGVVRVRATAPRSGGGQYVRTFDLAPGQSVDLHTGAMPGFRLDVIGASLIPNEWEVCAEPSEAVVDPRLAAPLTRGESYAVGAHAVPDGAVAFSWGSTLPSSAAWQSADATGAAIAVPFVPIVGARVFVRAPYLVLGSAGEVVWEIVP